MSVFKGVSYAEPLTQLHKLCFKAPWSYENFFQILSLPTTFGLGDEHGFLLCSDLGEDIEILTLAVHPSQQRKGIASSLLNELKQLAIQQHKKNIFLEVNCSNTPAKLLYLKNDFTQTGLRKNYYHEEGKAFDALCMTWQNPQQTAGD